MRGRPGRGGVLFAVTAAALVRTSWADTGRQGSGQGSGEERVRIEASLAAVAARVKKEEGRLARLEARRRALSAEVDAASRAAAEVKERRDALVTRLDRTTRRRDVVEKESRAAEDRARDARSRAALRLRALFVRSKGAAGGRMVARRAGRRDVTKALYFLKVFSEADKALIGRVARLGRAAEAQRRLLEAAAKDQVAVRVALDAESALLARRLAESARLLTEAGDRAAKAAESLAALGRESARLEKVVASLTDGDRPPPKREKRRGGRRTPGSFGDPPRALPLSAPIEGRLVRPFGKYKVAGFEDFVFHKGVELSASEGAGVRAVASGMVRFVGVMPGYGNVIIVDHGGRDYSLYGRLGKVTVRSGVAVDAGTVVGLVAAPDPRGRSLYFEMRRGGVPEDPSAFLPPFETG